MAWLAVCAACAWVSAHAAAYRYKDAQGQWVYADRPPPAGQASQDVRLGGTAVASPKMMVTPRSTEQGVALVAVNDCACPVEFAVRAQTAAGEKQARGTVQPRSEQVLLDVAATDGPSSVRYEYGYVVGIPGAQHQPPEPYRAPFALAQRFTVTQAPPVVITHRDAASRDAIDIAMPVGTAVHAARAGIVIDVAARHFRSGLATQNMEDANFVQVLHDDGTNAIYAHLQLDTVRVRPGQHIARGEYLANSGNTGFSSGPHLHFVVLRNAGLRSESVPVLFAGPGASAVPAKSGQDLVAY